MDDDEVCQNPPGYGDVIGGVVLYDPTADVVEAACVAFHGNAEEWTAWRQGSRADQADVFRENIKQAIRAAVEASSSLPGEIDTRRKEETRDV